MNLFPLERYADGMVLRGTDGPVLARRHWTTTRSAASGRRICAWRMPAFRR